jgi:hypothetical protein
MSKGHDEELMRFVDGELGPGESRAVEERLAKQPDAQRKASALSEVGAVVRARYQQATEEAEPQLLAMWARIEKGLSEPEEKPRQMGFLATLTEAFQAYRGYLATSLVSAAAGVLLATMVGTSTKVVETVRVVEEPTPPNVGATLAKSRDAEVESLEVAGGTGVIFQIPADKQGEAATTVIWVTPETQPAGAEGPI